MRWMLLLLLCPVAFANGTLTVRGRNGGVRQVSHKVSAHLRDRVAEVVVDQVFHNDTAQRLEGVYVFLLPDGAGVSDFAMTMAGKMVKGEVIERGKARRIYESIVRRKRDPGLLEQVDRGIFRARVFPIEPEQDLTIRLRYHQILPESDGAIEMRYPLAAERTGAVEGLAISIEAVIESSTDIERVWCASHRADIERKDDRKVTLACASSGRQQRDFLLYVQRDPAAMGFSLASHKVAGEDGAFLAVFAPPARVKQEDVLPKDVVFVLDTSGSMTGDKLKQAKAALRFGLETLRPTDRFNLVEFATSVRTFRDKLVGEGSIEPAKQWLEKRVAGGGTAIDEALQTALRLCDPERLGIVVFLTDGLPTVGTQDPDLIVDRVKSANKGSARVFVFGVGFDQNVKFLDRIASMTRAAREYISPGQDIEIAVSRFFERIRQPVLTDLRVEFGEGVHDVYPRPLPDLFAGDPLVVLGRYTKSGQRLVRLRGKLQGREVSYEYEGALSDKPGAEALQHLWAQRKVDFLLEQKASEEVRTEIVRLATKHSIVTPYTAGLVVEDSELETAGAEGLSDRPFTGPSTNSAIGLGGGGGGGKRGRGGRRNLRAGGGSGLTESAVELGLKWLADHQDIDADGRWDCDDFAKHDPAGDKRDGPGGALCDTGVTGLALLAFLGAGYTDRGSERENKYAKNVRNGLRFLMTSQDDSGCLAKKSLRGHAIAALALSEAYWRTRNPRYKKPAQEALDYVAHQRRPDPGWENDTRTTAWATVALKSGSFAGLDIDPDAFESARRWFDECPKDEPADNAAALFGRIMLGMDPRHSRQLQVQAKNLAAATERDDDAWYFGTLAMFQMGGASWKYWNREMKEALVKSQVPKGGDQGGSWSGDIVKTAKYTLCVEVYYRYSRVFGLR